MDAGGALAEGWRRRARWAELVALCEGPTDDQPFQPVIAELVALVRATVDDRKPLLSEV